MTTETNEEVTIEEASTPEEIQSTEQVTETTDETSKTVSQDDFNALYFKMKQAERELSTLREAGDTPVIDINETPTPEKEVTLESFDYDDEAYNKALVAEQVKTQVAAALAAQNAASTQSTLAAQQKQLTTDFNNKATAFAATNPDYEKAIAASGGVAFANHIQEVILQSEFGPQLDYAILSNPTIFTQLHSLTPTQAIMELGRMESSFKTPATQPAQVSQAPEPFSTGGGTANTGSDYRYDENQSMDAYYANYMAEQKAKNGG